MSRSTRLPAVSFLNADLGADAGTTLRVAGGRISELQPQRADRVLDLNGDRLLPGLINAHEHLQWNHLPQLAYPQHYGNASQWIAATHARLQGDATLRAHLAVSRARRLLSGALKNLLSGVTTVAHHDPLDALLLKESFPTRVLRRYGWSHSLDVDGETQVAASCAATLPDAPWIIHAAEGTDAAAALEFERLDELGCVRPNTLLVHGVGLSGGQRRRLAAAGAGLIWCPASNLRLFGRTAEVRELIEQRRVALGSDSRLTGASDLLAELELARGCLDLDEATLERLVSTDAARLLHLKGGAGTLAAGAPADLVVLPARRPLSRLRRAELRLVMLGGVARYGDAPYARALAAPAEWTEIRVDGHAKLLRAPLAALLASDEVKEPGVSLPAAPGRALCG